MPRLQAVRLYPDSTNLYRVPLLDGDDDGDDDVGFASAPSLQSKLQGKLIQGQDTMFFLELKGKPAIEAGATQPCSCVGQPGGRF